MSKLKDFFAWLENHSRAVMALFAICTALFGAAIGNSAGKNMSSEAIDKLQTRIQMLENQNRELRSNIDAGASN